MTPARGKLLVRPVETPETLPGGRIILTEPTRHTLTSQQAEVVAIGAPSRCDDDDCERPHNTVTDHRCHPLRLELGAWVLLAHRALTETDQLGLFVCSQDDVLAVLTP